MNQRYHKCHILAFFFKLSLSKRNTDPKTRPQRRDKKNGTKKRNAPKLKRDKKRKHLPAGSHDLALKKNKVYKQQLRTSKL